MYESFYKLKKPPFDLLSDPDFLYMSESHKKAYANLKRAIAETKEFVAVTGENGSGKTILIKHFLNNIKQKVKMGHIEKVDSSVGSFTKLICQKFDLDVEGKTSMGMLDFFHAFLLKQYEIKERVVIVIDNAHDLKSEAMEELWMLSNLESESFHLIQVILVGKPEFEYLLRRKDLQKFAQRITMRCHLENLSMAETGQYIRHRLEVAGAPNPDIFHKEAAESVYKYSNGNPHLINIPCDTALVDGFADNQERINKAVIENVTDEKTGGGLFPAAEKSKETGSSSPPAKSPIPAPSGAMPSNIEERIVRLESLANSIDNKLDILLKRKGGQDRTVVELNKMLMESLKRHGNTLKQFRSYREQVNKGKKSIAEAQKGKRSRSGDPLKKQKRTTPKKITHI